MTCASFIRLFAAIIALFLFSGTMAFAHSGHDHGAMASRKAQSVRPVAPAAPIATLTAVTAKLAVSLEAGLSADKQTTFVSAASPNQPDTPCGPGCCCNGPSSCGMAGGCAAHAIPPANHLALNAIASGEMMFPASDVRTGRAEQSLERPPKA